ncbi:O-antigen ligase family protein [Mycolicibacterium sp. 3033]|nr:O-antigen ligase family protein [Mycolicibacterium aurantiacum]
MTAVAIVVAGVADDDDGDALVRKIIYTWAAGAAVSAVYTVAESSPLGKSLALGDLPFVYYVASETRATGLAYHPNSLGQSIAVALPVLIFLVGKTRGLANVATISVVLISLYAIILSGSRAAVLLGAVLTVVTLTYFMKASKGFRVWVVPTIILSVMLSTSIAQKLVDRSRFDERSTYLSDTTRRAAVQSGIDLFGSNPIFGAGVGSWNAEMVLLIVLTSGGLIYFAIFYGSLIRPLIMRTRPSGNSLEAILTISAIGVLAFGLLNGSIVERYLYWPFVALFALRLWARPEQRGSAFVPSSALAPPSS